MRFTHDPESGAMYFRIREGKIKETLDLAEPGFGAHLDIDRRGYVLGVEFLSFEEYAELLARAGGALELPERVVDAEEIFGQSERDLMALDDIMDPSQKRVLELYFLEGLSRADIAGVLDISANTVSQRLRAGLNALVASGWGRAKYEQVSGRRVALSEHGRLWLADY